jgi:hypothetical protein
MPSSEPLALEAFLNDWPDGPQRTRDAFVRLKKALDTLEQVSFDFVGRPGITYSLRARHARQQKRDLFAMVDVIDDDPSNRWLSVCFYAEMITDPEELGDFVPGGLLGEDACCFDLEAWDDSQIGYIEQRLAEACRAAAQQG